ncbi:zinc finger protein 771 [Nematostella vectensis]|uniref:zinc finger protein 771 n=1 Tax=Nematostella vectensis TaxID=45351 RepID=UPI0020774D82|nr:zinc finger protein 771 [Nematostella vectensis]XP_048590528.1 zinc finger protein 771 [Nematostella vectensis]
MPRSFLVKQQKSQEIEEALINSRGMEQADQPTRLPPPLLKFPRATTPLKSSAPQYASAFPGVPVRVGRIHVPKDADTKSDSVEYSFRECSGHSDDLKEDWIGYTRSLFHPMCRDLREFFYTDPYSSMGYRNSPYREYVAYPDVMRMFPASRMLAERAQNLEMFYSANDPRFSPQHMRETAIIPPLDAALSMQEVIPEIVKKEPGMENDNEKNGRIKPEMSDTKSDETKTSAGQEVSKATMTTDANGSDVAKKPTSSASRKYRYTCDVCLKSFSRSNTLITHKRIHTGDKPFNCDQCGRAFRQPGNLTRHKLTHTTVKPYVCPQCNKAFNRASNLHTHMRTHTNYKPFVCDFCKKGFHQKIDMKIHRYTHTGEKPHKCQKCGRGFKQLTHLTYHMRTHAETRLYKCTICGKGFNQKGNLQAHIYGHTGERPFKCEICGKGFTLASTLNTHKRTHAMKKPFECQVCGKSFYQKNALKTHYISSHPFANGVSLL